MIRRRDGERAKEALLRAAIKVFAKYGYRKSTNAMLCRPCGLNPASVNYYFGSKGNLYREAWKRAHNEATKVFPVHGGVPSTAPPEERLMGRIRTMLYLYTDKRFDSGQMIVKELVSPSHILDDLWSQVLRNAQLVTYDIIRDILEDRATDQELEYYSVFISALCRLHFLTEDGKILLGLREVPIEDVIAHVYEFALGALYAKRDELRKKDREIS